MTLPRIEIDPALADSTVLYRTLDFFSAAAIIRDQSLMFARADTFQDKNEGVDRLLAQLQFISPSKAFGMGWHDEESARNHHGDVKKSHFISCWTMTEESVAMWSLYSPDYCSVRISTTVSKLRKPLSALRDKYSFARLGPADLGKKVVTAIVAHIAPVQYENIFDIAKQVSRRGRAMRRIEERYKARGKPLPTLSDIDPRYYEREKQRRLPQLESSFLLKDKSFEHENEVRLILRLGETTCTERVLEEQEFLDPEHQYHALVEQFLKMWGLISTVALPEREFSPCGDDLIESVAIDPRCPPHKAKFMREWFELNGVKVIESKCFGYLPSSFEVFPTW